MSGLEEFNILEENWQIGEFYPDRCSVEIETVRRGMDVPAKGYFVARTYSYADSAGPVAEAVADLPQLLKLLRDIVSAADRYSDTMREIGYGNMQFGSGADSVSLSGMAKALLAKHGMEVKPC